MLIGIEEFPDTRFGDVPVVVDFGTQLVIEIKTDRVFLLLLEAFIKLGDQGFRGRLRRGFGIQQVGAED